MVPRKNQVLDQSIPLDQSEYRILELQYLTMKLSYEVKFLDAVRHS